MVENESVVPIKDLDNLNEKLFDQINRLEIAKTDEDVKREVARTAAMVKAANALISAGKVALLAFDAVGRRNSKLPELIRLKEEQIINK